LNLKNFYSARSGSARKGDFGRVIVCGGSDRYAGCLAFNALAAMRAGADLAIVIGPRRAADIVAGFSADLITVPCDTSFPDPDMTVELLENADALVIGCGVARTTESHRALVNIIERCTKPMVVDAEALHALASRMDSIHGRSVLLTPNVGEFRILAGKDWPKDERERITAVQGLATQYKTTVIVKGGVDYISDGTRVYLDHNGSNYMTKGGYGDLLAGVAGAHLARGKDPFDAARVAAFVVGKAGEQASAKLRESTLATDVLAQFSSILQMR
jgi:hydroxyethylthiazole kinase-like uncharacterized protein yjeF